MDSSSLGDRHHLQQEATNPIRIRDVSSFTTPLGSNTPLSISWYENDKIYKNRKSVTYRNAARGPSHSHSSCTENLVKFGHVIVEMCKCTYIQTQTDRQTDLLADGHTHHNTLLPLGRRSNSDIVTYTVKISYIHGYFWRFFYILTKPIPNKLASVNQRNNEARAHIASSAHSSLFRRICGKLATEYPWMYGHFTVYGVDFRSI